MINCNICEVPLQVTDDVVRCCNCDRPVHTACCSWMCRECNVDAFPFGNIDNDIFRTTFHDNVNQIPILTGPKIGTFNPLDLNEIPDMVPLYDIIKINYILPSLGERH